MNRNNALHDKFGLNQQQIADWLGVSRSLVAHYERHVRDLPAAASQKVHPTVDPARENGDGIFFQSYNPKTLSGNDLTVR